MEFARFLVFLFLLWVWGVFIGVVCVVIDKFIYVFVVYILLYYIFFMFLPLLYMATM